MKFFSKRIFTFITRLCRLISYLIINPKLSLTVIEIITKYLLSTFVINRLIGKKFSIQKNDFAHFCSKELDFDYRDLFSNNIPSWLYLFEKFSFKNKKLEFLEIGSFEGRSSHFILSNLEKVHLTCVDTFKPFHELQENDEEKFEKIFSNFKKNIAKYSDRVEIVKAKSSLFFNKNSKKYDLIYLDGSHEFEDVRDDANEAFKILENNGIIIFDDFLWQYNQPLKKSITYAIIDFINTNKYDLEIFYVNYQLIIKKIH